MTDTRRYGPLAARVVPLPLEGLARSRRRARRRIQEPRPIRSASSAIPRRSAGESLRHGTTSRITSRPFRSSWVHVPSIRPPTNRTALIQPAVRDTSGLRAIGSRERPPSGSRGSRGRSRGATWWRWMGRGSRAPRSPRFSTRRRVPSTPGLDDPLAEGHEPGLRMGAPPCTPHQRASSPSRAAGERREVARNDIRDGGLAGRWHPRGRARLEGRRT